MNLNILRTTLHALIVPATLLAQADLSVSHQVEPVTVEMGGIVSSHTIVRNSGPESAIEVKIRQFPPQGSTFISASAGPAIACRIERGFGTGAFVCPVARIAVGETIEVLTTFAAPNQAVPFQSIAHAFADQGMDPDRSNNVAVATLNVVLSPGAPALYSLSPNSASTKGGDEIRIQGANLDVACFPGCLRFGGQPATFVRVLNATAIIAVTPPHPPGVVDVDLNVPGKPVATFKRFAYREPVEPVLLPFTTGTLARSSWSAELWVWNDADRNVNLFPEVCFGLGGPSPCLHRIEVPPRSAQLLTIFGGVSAAMVYVPIDHLRDIHFSLRVRNVLSEPTSAGTEIPVIRASRLRHGRTNLLNVPLSSPFRLNFRMFTPDLFASQSYRVKIYGMHNQTLLLDREIHESLPTDPPSPTFVPATFDFSSLLVDVAGSGEERVRVEIEPLFPVGLRYWPLITVTNNETQQVTTITPQ